MRNIINRLKSSILLSVLLLSSMSSFAVQAKDFQIESDKVFISLISELDNPGANVALYQESKNYRLDLTLFDIVDRTSVVLSKMKFNKYRSQLDAIFSKSPLQFSQWFKKLKQLADKDEKFFDILDKRLSIQLYTQDGFAIIPQYKYIDLEKFKNLGLLSRITRYNNILSDPEGRGLRAVFKTLSQKDFITSELTVGKLRKIKRKSIKKLKKAYYRSYLKQVKLQHAADVQIRNHKTRYPILEYKLSKRNGIRSRGGPSRPVDYEIETLSVAREIKIFNAINGVSHKNALLDYLASKLKEKDIIAPKRQGMIILTPTFIYRNFDIIQNALHAYTARTLINLDDDEYLLRVRKWVKRNISLIQNKIKEFNQTNQTRLAFTVRAKKLPKRLSILKQYQTLEQIFPKRPWNFKIDTPDMIDRKGKAKYFSDSKMKIFGRKMKAIAKSLIKVETYTSLIAGSAVMVATGGNYALSMSTKKLVKKAVYTVKHNKEWKEFLQEAPLEVLTAFLTGAGFTSGRLYKILALGAAQGTLQSMMTGQDIRTGAFVGAGMNLLNAYVLPAALAKPMSAGFDSSSLSTNAMLEILEKTIKNGAQGAIVAGLTGQEVLRGFKNGAAYGAISTIATILFLGTRYNPFKDYTDQEVDEMIAAENAFQNDVGRGGEYAITRQMILDSNYRTGGMLPGMISASITLPGNVSMSGQGFTRITTMTHEAHHLMQQTQSGVFGFYLFRYIPTGIMTGYSGHPDENFLRKVLQDYLGVN